MALDKINLATVEKMWRREVEAAHTYKLLAERESDPKRRDILLRLAEQEDKHAARWSERIHAATGRVPDPREIERGLTWFQRSAIQRRAARLEQEETQGRRRVRRAHGAAERSGGQEDRGRGDARRARSCRHSADAGRRKDSDAAIDTRHHPAS